MYLTTMTAVEMLCKNALNRNFNLKPISSLTDFLFYDSISSLDYLFKLDSNARVLNTDHEVDIKCEFNYSGYDVSFHFKTMKKLPKKLKNSILLTFFLNKEMTISKDGIEIYKDGFISSEYKNHSQNIQNLFWFVADDIRNGHKVKNKQTNLFSF